MKEIIGEHSPLLPFELAADAIVAGNVGTLASLLVEHPELVRARSARPHRSTLLHYLGANGVEQHRQKSPENAVEVAMLLLVAGAEIDAVADIYGKSTTLGLLASSNHPKQAGVQTALLGTLLDHGALIDGPPECGSSLNAALRNGHPESAEYLARCGARLDLEGAAGVGSLPVVESFFDDEGRLKAHATREQLELGFLWACEYGRNTVVQFLLGKGVDVHTQGTTGLTGLHWAVVGGQLETINLLLQKGAPLEVRNVHGATALGQALWSSVNGPAGIDWLSILRSLINAGAKIEDGSLAWLAEQGSRSSPETARIADLLRSHGANS